MKGLGAVIGQAVTVVRVVETTGFLTYRKERRTLTVKGTVLDVQSDGDGNVTGLKLDAVRVETGKTRVGWYAVGPDALKGSMCVSQTATLDACGHPVTYGCDCDTIEVESRQGDVRPVWRLVCSVCGDTRPDADVEGEGVSRGARCGYVVCEGFYRYPDASVTADQERAAVHMCTYSSRIDRPTTCPLDLV